MASEKNPPTIYRQSEACWYTVDECEDRVTANLRESILVSFGMKHRVTCAYRLAVGRQPIAPGQLKDSLAVPTLIVLDNIDRDAA